jgi:hypothetical protein
MARIRAVTGVSTPEEHRFAARPFSPSPGTAERAPALSPPRAAAERELREGELEELRAENLRLKTDLFRIEKRIELEEEENRKLAASLQKSKGTVEALGRRSHSGLFHRS